VVLAVCWPVLAARAQKEVMAAQVPEEAFPDHIAGRQ